MTADSFVGIPFQSQGRDYAGVDCWGLVWLWYRDVMGIELTAYAETPADRVRDVAALVAEHKSEWRKVDDPQPNDVVLMRVARRETSRLVAHVGVVMPKRMVMHTEEPIGTKLERLCLPHVQPRIMEFRRHRLA